MHSGTLKDPEILSHFVLLCVFQSYKIINFAPTLLQIIVSEQVEFPVRQAGKKQSNKQTTRLFSLAEGRFILFEVMGIIKSSSM